MDKVLTLYSECCNNLQQQSLFRTLPILQPKIDFSHTDYLGLSKNRLLLTKAMEYMNEWGVGSSSRLLLGTKQKLYLEVEEMIANSFAKERALIFSSGYQLNATVLAAILDKKTLKEKPLVFTDRLNHNSLHSGCALAKVKQTRYNHLDMDHLEHLLIEHKDAKAPKFIITESLFSTEGDMVDMAKIIALKKQFNAVLYVDDSHAVGLYGKNGYGICEDYAEDIDIIMGSFSKGVGSFGGYVASNNVIIEYLINKCSGFIYSTALPPMVIGAIYSAWQLIPDLAVARAAIMDSAAFLKTALVSLGFSIGTTSSHIVPVMLKDSHMALDIKEQLLMSDIAVGVIRPPTVVTPRLRINVSAEHKVEMIEQLLDHLDSIWQNLAY